MYANNFIAKLPFILSIFAIITICNISTIQSLRTPEEQLSLTTQPIISDATPQKAVVLSSSEELTNQLVNSVTHSKLETIKAVLSAVTHKAIGFSTNIKTNTTINKLLIIFYYTLVYPTKLALYTFNLLWSCMPGIVQSIITTTIALLIVLTLWKWGYFNLFFGCIHTILHAFQRIMSWLGLTTLANSAKIVDVGMQATQKAVDISAHVLDRVTSTTTQVTNFVATHQEAIQQAYTPVNNLITTVQSYISPSIPTVLTPVPTLWAQSWDWFKYLWNNGNIITH